MTEAWDFDPGPWKGHDFKSAKKQYDVHVGRSYQDAVKSKINPNDLVPSSISTESKAPLVVACDVTGSMGDSPATIFSKCPYLDIEGKEYLGDDMVISFAAIGDAYSDQYPLQVRPFSKDLDLKEQLKKMVIEGGGGGQSRESYDLGALYYARNVDMPNAVNPIMIFIGDEGIYDFIDNQQANIWARTTLEKRTTFKQVFTELKRKFSVYVIRQPYSKTGSDKMSDADKIIHKQWESVLGLEHMAFLPDAARVVDVIFGILAKETGKVDYFVDEINGRQTKKQVKSALKGLNSIHALPAPKKKSDTGKSAIHKKSNGKDSQPLI